MIIALTGAHSTGKTTLLEELRKEGLFKEYKFAIEITREIARRGFKINEEAGVETQKLIIDSHLENLKKENIIMDRCLLDGIVYTHYLVNNNKIEESEFPFFLSVFKDNINKYDYLFYIEPEFDIVSDGIRSANPSFQKEIVSIFNYYIEEFKIPIIKITGDIKNRLKIIKESL